MFICVRRDWDEMENAKMSDLNRHSVIRSSSTAGWKMTNICYVDGMESRNVNTWMGSITTPESSRETKAEPLVFFLQRSQCSLKISSDVGLRMNFLHEIIIMDEVRM